MDKMLLHFSVLTLFIALINKCVGDDRCLHPCVGGHLCSSKQFLGTCYFLFKDERRNWDKSHEFCVGQKLSMVKFTKEMIDGQFSVRDLYPLGNDIWLGGRASDLGKWVFLNNTVANKLLPLPVAWVDPYKHAYCASLHINEQNIEVDLGVCSNGKFSLCRKAHCERNGSCLELYEKKLNWFEGRSYCIDSGGDLFYLKDNETLTMAGLTVNNAIYERLKFINLYVHIGLRHQRLEWTDGTEILYTKWDGNGPDNLQDKCILMNGSTEQWSDHDCFDDKLAFCQEEANRRVPNNNNNEVGGLTPTSTIRTTSTPKPAGPTRNNNLKLKSSVVTAETLTVITIVLGSLLGLFIIITLVLVIRIVCRKYKNKSTEDDAEFIENNYYDSSSEQIRETPVAAPLNSFYTNSETVAETLSSHLRAVPETNGATATSNEKPRIRPKPIFGPKSGDVYSSVEKVNKSPLRPFKSAEYVNST